MTIKNPYPGDIYRDTHGRAWVVRAFWSEPVVQMEQIWPANEDSPNDRKIGGVSSGLWECLTLVSPADRERKRKQKTVARDRASEAAE